MPTFLVLGNCSSLSAVVASPSSTAESMRPAWRLTQNSAVQGGAIAVELKRTTSFTPSKRKAESTTPVAKAVPLLRVPLTEPIASSALPEAGHQLTRPAGGGTQPGDVRPHSNQAVEGAPLAVAMPIREALVRVTGPGGK